MLADGNVGGGGKFVWNCGGIAGVVTGGSAPGGCSVPAAGIMFGSDCSAGRGAALAGAPPDCQSWYSPAVSFFNALSVGAGFVVAIGAPVLGSYCRKPTRPDDT